MPIYGNYWNISIYRHKESGYILACLYHGAIFGCGQGSLKLSQFLYLYYMKVILQLFLDCVKFKIVYLWKPLLANVILLWLINYFWQPSFDVLFYSNNLTNIILHHQSFKLHFIILILMCISIVPSFIYYTVSKTKKISIRRRGARKFCRQRGGLTLLTVADRGGSKMAKKFADVICERSLWTIA